MPDYRENFNKLVSQLETPKSLINFLDPRLQEAVLSIPQELVDMNEEELRDWYATQRNYKVSAMMDALRVNFWMEFDRVSASRVEKVMSAPNIYFGVCSEQHFNRVVVTPWQLAFLIIRPPEYEAVMKGMLTLSTRKIRDILNIPVTKENGELQDPKMLELILKAAAMVDLRARGNYLNRSETKNLTYMEQTTKSTSVNVSYTEVFDKKKFEKTAVEMQADLDDRIKELELELGKGPLPPPSVDPINVEIPSNVRKAAPVEVLKADVVLPKTESADDLF
jgi:hypothetical protein